VLKQFPLHWFLLLAVTFALSCKCHKKHFTTTDSLSVKDNVTHMAASIAADVSAKGPVAWLKYFQDSPGFFMANDGQLAFHNYQSAKVFIQDTLVKAISKITLRWSNLRICPLSPRIASIGSNFHEDITFANGKIMPTDGYFSGIAILTSKGWQLQSCHWSAKNK